MTNQEHNEDHKIKFIKWSEGRNIQSESDRTDLKKGDKVTFTNDFGVVFEDHEILGFDSKDFYGRFIYLDYDCFWFPAKPENLTKQ